MALRELPTYRNHRDTSGLPIQKVGIRNVRAPFRLYTKDSLIQGSVGTWSIYTDLTKQLKGISMSIMQRTLFESLEHNMSIESLVNISKKIIEESKSRSSYVSVKFPYYIRVNSPKTNIPGFKCYDCQFEVTNINGKIRKYLNIRIQYIATCPCSLELAKHLKKTEGKESGPHQQRGYADIKIEFNESVWIEDLIKLVEDAVVAIPYPIARKQDEQFICYTAHQNTCFVEESSRRIAMLLNKNKKIIDFVAVCNHEESLHSSDATAVIRKGKELM